MDKVYNMSATSNTRVTKVEWSSDKDSLWHFPPNTFYPKPTKLIKMTNLYFSPLSTQLYHYDIKHKAFASYHPGDFPYGHFGTIPSIALQFPNTPTRMEMTMAGISRGIFNTHIGRFYTYLYSRETTSGGTKLNIKGKI